MAIETTSIVKDLALDIPGATRLFESLGIDYCCNGGKPLAQACGEAGIAVETVVQTLKQAAAGAGENNEDRNWSSEPLTALISFIIGSKPPADFNDPLGVLTDCHRRIEHFVRLLVSVSGQITEAEPNREQREALETALQYFRHAAPQHTLDEEESLFPRLRLARDPRAGSVLSLLQLLSTGHDLADDMHHEIERLFVRWFLDRPISASDHKRLAELLADLAGFYAEHIAIEERDVFPLARVVLSQEQLHLIGREMAERRGTRFRESAG